MYGGLPLRQRDEKNLIFLPKANLEAKTRLTEQGRTPAGGMGTVGETFKGASTKYLTGGHRWFKRPRTPRIAKNLSNRHQPALPSSTDGVDQINACGGSQPLQWYRGFIDHAFPRQ